MIKQIYYFHETKWDIPKTLLMTVEWYKRILEGENTKLVTMEQIEKFFNFKFDD